MDDVEIIHSKLSLNWKQGFSPSKELRRWYGQVTLSHHLRDPERAVSIAKSLKRLEPRILGNRVKAAKPLW